ncbi:hypothetical protein AB0I51_05845 [Streptomyces sp. NPDC050549]|uniref:hypothetical protein n=1 Tax=Streptomyces sp. NPDC050549 TaxID=3155406 RepID=UPI003441B158
MIRPDDAAVDEWSFSARMLNLLFEAAGAGRNGVEYTNTEVAAAINRRAGRHAISDETIRKLRAPGGPQPSFDKVAHIAAFFQVPLDAFKEGSAAYEAVAAEANRLMDVRREHTEQVTRQVEEESEGIRMLARSARRLDSNGLKIAMEFISSLHKMQKSQS